MANEIIISAIMCQYATIDYKIPDQMLLVQDSNHRSCQSRIGMGKQSNLMRASTWHFQ
jgi:hypothetical protein